MIYHTVTFKNQLPISFREDLERIFFFNARQSGYSEKIQTSLEKFGLMKIVEKSNFITLEFDKTNPQCLFALDGESHKGSLLGVVCYDFLNDICEIYHIAVEPECAVSGHFESEMITYRLVEKVRKLAIDKNLSKVFLPYSDKFINVKQKILNILE
jgi:hypothetical protein